jgi:hypothetical protein
MRKLQEFEMFKRLILDKEQERLFRSLPKPNLTHLDFSKESKGGDEGESQKRKTKSVLSEPEEKELAPLKQGSDNEGEGNQRTSTLVNNAQDLKNAYEKVKKKDDKISQKLLQAFEETLIQVRSRAATKRLTNLEAIKELDLEEQGLGTETPKQDSVKIESGSEEEKRPEGRSDGE